nr:cation transporter [Clostridia bacterium]
MNESELLTETAEATGKTGRDKTIVRTSVIGILANIFLAAFKAAIGMLSHSIAIVLDAVNNLS